MSENEREFRKHLGEYNAKNVDMHRLSEISKIVCRKASRMRMLAEHDCNRGLTEREKQEDERLQDEIRTLLREVNDEIRVRFDGDPRGYVVRVLFPQRRHPNGFMTRPYNTWGGEDYGFGIGS